MATDGLEGFDMVRRRFERTGESYKLIIMDIFMPICDGFKSTEMIRAYLKEKEELGQQLEKAPYICLLTA